MKTLLIQVMWPAWVWTKWPHAGFMFATYSQELSMHFAMKCRDLVVSPWYQQFWGSKVKIRKDTAGKKEFGIVGGGWRMATSPGGQATGRHPDFAVFDDPHNVVQAESELQRTSAVDWWRNTMSTRGQARNVRQIGIMQRLNADDLSAYCIQEGGWEHLVFPIEFEHGRMKKTSIGWEDPRKEEGELLWPEVFGREKVNELKHKLGPYGTAGQLQQRPAPASGGMFDAKLFRYFNVVENVWHDGHYESMIVLNTEQGERRILAKDCFWFQTVDTALKLADQNAYTVVGTFLLTPQPVSLIVYDIFRQRIPIPEQFSAVIQQRTKYPRVATQYVEEAASGHGLLQEGKMRGMPFRALRPAVDKAQRATAVATMYSNGMVYHRLQAPWLMDFEGELLSFPNGNNKDQVDVLAYAGIIAQGSGADRRIVGRNLVLWPTSEYHPTDASKLALPDPEKSRYAFPKDQRSQVLSELIALGKRSRYELN